MDNLPLSSAKEGRLHGHISSLLSDHVAFELRSIDRIFLQAYCPALQTMGQVIKFLLHKGFPIPSGAVKGALTRFPRDQ